MTMATATTTTAAATTTTTTINMIMTMIMTMTMTIMVMTVIMKSLLCVCSIYLKKHLVTLILYYSVCSLPHSVFSVGPYVVKTTFVSNVC